MKVYFDNAATTPMLPEVTDAMVPVMRNMFGNPSSIHSYGREVRTLIENARKSIAKIINCSPGEIFFTSGGTEANNMALRSSVAQMKLTHAITSPIEHHAVLHTLEDLEHSKKIKLSFVNIDTEGRVDLEHLEHLLKTNDRTFVSLMHANNEIGTLLPLKQAGEICRKYDAVFHCDTVQTMGHLPFDMAQLNLDFCNCAAHKFHGPKGIGFIYINHKTKIKPFITGGSQERNMRAGTENVYGIVGLAKAMEIAYANLETDMQYIQGLKNYMKEQLKAQIPDITFNGSSGDDCLYTVLNVSFPESPVGEMLLFNLDINGIAVSGGSACSSGSNIGSHVLKGIQADQKRSSVRFSFSKLNNKEEVDFTIQQLKGIFKLAEV